MGLGLVIGSAARADQSVTLTWNPSSSSDLAGYMVLSSSDGTNYVNQMDAGTNTVWSVTGLQDGTTNYFEVEAYDVNHNASPPSNPVECIVPETTQTPAAPPMLAAVPDQSVNVGSIVLVTNTVTDANVPPRQITFSLGAGAPAGTSISTNGVFEWDPACEQGSTTNLITVWALDNGMPALCNSISFEVTVGACVRVTIGSSAVLIGNETSVPINLYSTVGLTNLSFSLATLAGRFGNWGFAASNPGLVTAAVQAPDASQPQFNLAVPSGQALLGASSLGTISVQALASGDSAFAPLTVNSIVATASDNTQVGSVFVSPGRVVLIAGQPLLEASLSNGSNPGVTLYGTPGSNYTVMSTTNLSPPITWTSFTNFILPTPVQFITPGPYTNQMEFFRALQQ
jgi:hypothetical protein